ncbi:MAG TPA: asparagine synthase (glutamine-hydrolyzing) [Crocinitomix sp.]|nr:asparagine synthase (glutamine-hydrolyzing) [Crocinitomix sp.]
MCGINGYITYSNLDLNNNLEAMNKSIIHRGPDEDGFYFDNQENFSIGMAMRRLSIIDLKTGKQPIYNTNKDIVIVFNGEIYNYKELKKKYLKDTVFNTNSDTEVILKLYEKYGAKSFQYLDGMYAFSIYDKAKNKVFIARDFFGEKPLYYTSLNNNFIWASELKSIVSQLNNKPNISRKALNLYFSLTYIPAPYSIYEGISKLEANHFIEYNMDTKDIAIHKIDLNTKKQKIYKGSFNDAKKTTKELVEKSVRSRTVADVPIGTFLSGGVDSSIVSLCLANNSNKKIDTFSIGFEKKSFDESSKARTVAKIINSNHHEFIVNKNSLSENIHEILLNFDEPFADSSALPTYLVSKITSNHVKVALTGDGGDEVFGGYNKYGINTINKKYTKYISASMHKLIKQTSKPLLNTKTDNRGLKFKIKKVVDAIDYNNNFYYNMISLGFKKNELKFLLKNDTSSIFSYYKNELNLTKSDTLYDLRQIDKHISLEGDMLVKVDRTSMLSSIECRAPFLNKELWNFTNSLPDSFLIHKKSKKHILKEAFKNQFPNQFLDLSKQGFGVPVGDWLRGKLKSELESYTEKEFIDKQDIFNYLFINNLVKNHLAGIEDNTFKIWTFYCFQKWYVNNIN